MSIDVKVPRSRRQPELPAVHLLRERDLAAQPAGLLEAEGHVEHVLLLLGGGFEGGEEVVGEDGVAGGARAHALAGSFELCCVLCVVCCVLLYMCVLVYVYVYVYVYMMCMCMCE